jgi:MFS family permease
LPFVPEMSGYGDNDYSRLTGAEPAVKPALLSPLRHRDFRLFWTGLLLSSIGSQFTTVTIAWQIYELTDSPLQIGLIGLARAIPQAAVLLFGGLLADAINRRRLMMGTQASLFVVSGTLAVVTLGGKTSPLTLYLATVALAFFTALESPSRQAIVANLVPRADLPRALAMYSSQRYIAIIAGPSIAGMVLAFVGPAACYSVDAISWLIMLGALSLIQAAVSEGAGRSAVSFYSLRTGLRFVRGHAVIFPLLIMDFGVNIFGGIRALLPIYARDILAVGPEGLGLLYAASAVGALLGATGFSIVGQVRRAGRWILVGVTLYGFCLVLFAGSHVFWLSVLLLIGSGVGDTISAVLRATINQLSTPDELRGRMASINSIFTNSGPQLGQFEAGALAALVGAEVSAMTGGLIILLIVLVLVFGFPNIREYQLTENYKA